MKLMPRYKMMGEKSKLPIDGRICLIGFSAGSTAVPRNRAAALSRPPGNQEDKTYAKITNE